MKATWLGQSGYLFENNGERLLIDPFYSDIVEQKEGMKRLMQPPIPIHDLKPNVIFITHNHLDHFDPIALPEIHRHFPKVSIAGPESVMHKAAEFGFDPNVLNEMPAGTVKIFGEFKITSTLAFHGDPFSVGCVIQAGGKNSYYSGDTLFNELLIENVKMHCLLPLDYLFIVINGRLGNMNLHEAVETARQLKPAYSIPMHYGMFEENTADPHEFVAGCKESGLKTHIMELGKTIDFNFLDQ